MRLFRFLILVVSLAFPGLVYAQSTDASLTGLVDDPSKAVIQGVSITAINTQTGVKTSTLTNGSGQYVLATLIPGTYRIEVDKQGFKGIIEAGLVLHVQDIVQINFHMAVGSMSETVTVDASSLQMNTADGSVSTVIDRNFVANIPLNGRSFQDLISLAPGVVSQSPQSGSFAGVNGDFSVNGQRTESNNYMVDGIPANTNPGDGQGFVGANTGGNLPASTALGTTQSLISVDALQEFRAQTSTYSAESGSFSGGQFSFTTRSGTGSFHGSVFDYLRNGAFDANDWFNDYYDVAQPALRQNDFGGVIGGPVILSGRRKGEPDTFFFVSYEGLRLEQPYNAKLEYVPSDSMRTAAPSAIQPILNAFPLPTGAEVQIACDNVTYQCPTGDAVGTLVPSGLAPNTLAYSAPSQIDSISARLDHNFDAHFRAFLRAAYTPSFTDSRQYQTLSDLGSTKSNQQGYTAGLDDQISTSVSDELRVGYSRSSARGEESLDSFGGGSPVNLSQAMGNLSSPTAYSLFDVSFRGVGSTDILAESPANYLQQWAVTDSLGWTIGREFRTIGISYARIASRFAPSDPSLSSLYETPGSILDNSATYCFCLRRQSGTPVYEQFALFGQDEWRVKPTLSLSLGLRWEIQPAPYSVQGAKPYPLLGVPDDPSTYHVGTQGSTLYNTRWNNLAPRAGVAWQLHTASGRESVLRAGFGVFYDTGASGTAQVFQGLGSEVYDVIRNFQLPATPADLDLSFPTTPPYQNTVSLISPDFRLPLTLQWSLALQQALGSGQSLTLSYVAANGRRLVEQAEYSGGTLNPEFTTLQLIKNGLTSNYQALQLQFQRNVSHGLQVLAAYTWSHSLDYGSTDADVGYERGNSNFDVRNALNAALTWDLPKVGEGLLAGTALNGWGMDLRMTARSAFPVTLAGNYFFDPVTGSGEYSGLDLVPGSPIYIYSQALPGGRQINPNAFAAAPDNSLGDAPRNFARGFGETQINFAVRREFPIYEGLKLQFRAETFNVLNHPSFGYVDPNLGDSTFGQATSTLANSLGTVSPLYQQGGARSMQFALKVSF